MFYTKSKVHFIFFDVYVGFLILGIGFIFLFKALKKKKEDLFF